MGRLVDHPLLDIRAGHWRESVGVIHSNIRNSQTKRDTLFYIIGSSTISKRARDFVLYIIRLIRVGLNLHSPIHINNNLIKKTNVVRRSRNTRLTRTNQD